MSVSLHCICVVGMTMVSNSLQNFELLNKEDVFLHVIWRQNCRPEEFTYDNCIEYELEEISLSKARNILLRDINQELQESVELENELVIFFLDDDQQVTIEQLSLIKQFGMTDQMNCIIGAYQPINGVMNRKRFPIYPIIKCSRKDLLRMASSATLYFKASQIHPAPYFDENLGVGAVIGVGEDTEYALRLLNYFKRISYLPSVVTFHPYKTQKYPIDLKFTFLVYLSRKSIANFYLLIRFTLHHFLRGELDIQEVFTGYRLAYGVEIGREHNVE